MLTQEQEEFLAAFADAEMKKIKDENERIRLSEEARVKQEEIDNRIKEIRLKKEQEAKDEIASLGS